MNETYYQQTHQIVSNLHHAAKANPEVSASQPNNWGYNAAALPTAASVEFACPVTFFGLQICSDDCSDDCNATCACCEACKLNGKVEALQKAYKFQG